MGSELLSFEGVDHAYPNGVRLAGRFPALRRNSIQDVSFSVHAGSTTALLGGNGSGKTTLLRLADGLLVPDSGTIRWEGRPLDRSRSGLARLRSEVGLLFQDPDDQLFAGTLSQDVAFGPLNQGLGRREVEIRVQEALDAMGLAEFAELPPHVLSHGLRKRAALAGVIAMRPRLLLLDEPTAGLDPESEQRLLEVLGSLVASGSAAILSTHDLDLARRWARDALLLSQGRLAASGPVEQILSDTRLLASSGLRGRFPVLVSAGAAP